MSAKPSLFSLIRGFLLTGTLFFAAAGAAQAADSGAGDVAEPTVVIPSDGDVAEDARVHRRKRRRALRRVLILRTPPRIRVRTYRPPRTVVVHHKQPDPVVVAAPPRVKAPAKASSWVHVGGGFGSVAGEAGDQKTDSAARVVFGGGGQKRILYGGGEVAVTASKTEPFDITGAGYIGAALPAGAFQPMIGFRAGAGQHLSGEEFKPHLVIGPQMGFIARRPGDRLGLRMMVDLGLDYGIEERRVSPELFVTFSAAF